MLLTVNRLGSTNISLRRFTRARRGSRLSAGGGPAGGTQRGAASPAVPDEAVAGQTDLRADGGDAAAGVAPHGVLLDDQPGIHRVESIAHVAFRIGRRPGDGVSAGRDRGPGD